MRSSELRVNILKSYYEPHRMGFFISMELNGHKRSERVPDCLGAAQYDLNVEAAIAFHRDYRAYRLGVDL